LRPTFIKENSKISSRTGNTLSIANCSIIVVWSRTDYYMITSNYWIRLERYDNLDSVCFYDDLSSWYFKAFKDQYHLSTIFFFVLLACPYFELYFYRIWSKSFTQKRFKSIVFLLRQLRWLSQKSSRLKQPTQLFILDRIW
jgi:hypothetical protein